MNCSLIIIVEDDPDIREVMAETLRNEGFTVQSFSDGRAALEGFERLEQPCVILLDLMMPIMNGWEFLEERQKRGGALAATPVVIVSAVVNSKVAAMPGVQGYIKKPLDLNVLFRMVHSYCEEPSAGPSKSGEQCPRLASSA